MSDESAADYVETHPLLDMKGAHFDTTCYRFLLETITEWLWTASTGGFIVGAPRIGKSWAVRSLTNELRLRNGKAVPVLYMSMADRDIKTIAQVSRQACIDQGLLVSSRATADQLSKHLLNHIMDLQTVAGVRTAVLIVDEFDLLSPRQFNPFAEFFNHLDRQHRTLTVIFVGNRDEANLLLAKMVSGQYGRIRGRFFKRYVEVFGVRSQQELQALMAQYDTLRYPVGGPTYTHYFLPAAVDSGWRFAGLSRNLWRQYSAIAKDFHLDSWGMEFLVGTLNILITDLLPHYGWQDIDDELLREAILMTHVTDDFVRVLEVKGAS